LKIDNKNIALTAKESCILQIFAENINKEITRERLQKEIWEDKGVIVGRSLDVFISKLRKKLNQKSGINIVSIHGKGYKLTVS
jgi:DNA-binding response OmpR family regulator